MNIVKSLILVSVLMLVLLGCTSKTNPVGMDWSHIRPTAITDSLITSHYSFAADFKLTGNEQRLVIGKYEQKEAKALIQFGTMPDSIYQIVGTPTLRLVLNKKQQTTPMTIQFAKVIQNWSESGATWTNAYTSPDTTWLATYTVPSGIADFNDLPDTVAIGGDTLHIDIPAESILNFRTTGVTGYTLQISTEQTNYLEIRSTETLFAPRLEFKYKRTAADTTTYSYDRYAANDTFILRDLDTQVTSGSLFLRNITPTRIFMKFDVPASLFSDAEGAALSADEIKHMTINKAELVLKVKNNPYYGNLSTFIATVYRVKEAVTDTTVAIPDEQMEFIAYTQITTTSPGLGTIALNFAPVMQKFTSDASSNHGIIIRLTTENQDYSKVEFYGMNDPDLTKRPKINIIYTPPAF